MLPMKRILNLITVIVFSSLFIFSSCKKEEPLRPDNSNTVVENDAQVEGVNWVLYSGRIYVENLDNGEKYVYDHFGGGQTESNLAIFDGWSDVKMDSIKENYTTWFFNNGTFTLNGTHSYTYTEYNYTYTPNGLENGSSRPIEVTHISDDYMVVTVHEGYASDGTSNYEFVNQLVFLKSGSTCTSCVPDVNYGYVYGGVWNSPNSSTASLAGTTWVVTRYDQGMTPYYPNDTLDFISNSFYTINGSGTRTYSLSNVVGNNNKSLSLYSFSTVGGDYSGEVIGTFIDDGVVNNSQFVDMFDVNNTVTVWMTRIQ
jgi:hypothetical protein